MVKRGGGRGGGQKITTREQHKRACQACMYTGCTVVQTRARTATAIRSAD